MDVVNKIVLVTGASSGIGAAIARSMSKAGAKEVLLLARRKEPLKKVAEEIRSTGGKASVYPVDLSSADTVRSVSSQIIEHFGTPDIIVNNAGAELRNNFFYAFK